jgi:molecular chaperone GrpE
MVTSQNPAQDNELEETGEQASEEALPAGETPEAAGEAARIGQLQDEVARLTEETNRLRDQWVRAVAETDNIRKRSQRELEETSRYAITGFARDMVSVLENLKRASESIPADQRNGNDLLKTIGEGVDLTLQELLNTFQKFGINRIDPQGQKFDHNLHQAVVQVERDDVPAGTVVQVVQAGYVIHDRLLRPAMVAVSKAAEPPQKVDTTA